VQWEGHTAHTARALLSESHDDDENGARTVAEHWLSDYLTEQGAAPSKAVKVAAAKVGIAERTLKRAVQSLGVVIESRDFPRVTWWQLPSQATPPDRAPDSENLGPTGPTVDDVQKCTGPTKPISQSGQQVGVGPAGALTEKSLGQTDRIFAALDAARRAYPPICPSCQRAPARPDSGLCDFCTTRQQAVTAAKARLSGEAS
jgi:hypothetical protein